MNSCFTHRSGHAAAKRQYQLPRPVFGYAKPVSDLLQLQSFAAEQESMFAPRHMVVVIVLAKRLIG